MKFSLNPKPVDFNAMAKAIANVSQPPEASQTPIHDGVFPLNDRLQPVKVVINGETNRSRGLNVGQVAKQIFTTTEAAEKAHKINDAQVNLTHVVNGLEEIKKGVQDEQSAKQRQTQSPLKKFIFRHFDHSQKTISHIEKTIVIVKKSALEKDIDLLKASTIETEKLLKKNVELLTKTSSQLSQHLSGSQPIQKNIEDKTKELQRLLNVEATDSESMLPGINRLITDVSNKEVHMNKSKETELKEKKLSDHAENYLVWITLGNLLRTTHLQRQTLQKAKTNYTKACRAFNEAKKQYDDAFATGEKAKELRIQLSTLQAQLKTELDRNRPITRIIK